MLVFTQLSRFAHCSDHDAIKGCAFRSAFVRPLAAGALQLVLIVCIRFSGRPDQWIQMILQGVLAGIGSAAVVLGVGMVASERQRFVVEPLRRLWRTLTEQPTCPSRIAKNIS